MLTDDVNVNDDDGAEMLTDGVDESPAGDVDDLMGGGGVEE